MSKNKFIHIELLISFKIYGYLIWVWKIRFLNNLLREIRIYASSQNITKPKGDTKNRLTMIEEAEP